ncbi:MAG TPA: alkaline phosphatase family protein [Gemmataceae bacterium]|nr:alkaline phosphatase family protein [Gemmataceae bacterium]
MRAFPIRTSLLAVLAVAAAVPLTYSADAPETLKVGEQPDGRIVVPTNQILKPAGRQITFPGRPVDLAFAEDGKVLVVKSNRSLELIELATGKVRQTLSLLPIGDPKPGFSVVGLVVRDGRVYASDSQGQVRVVERKADGKYTFAGKHIDMVKPRVGGLAHPAGMALLSDEEMMVASTRGNNVQVVNLATGQAEQVVGVGVAPFAVLPVGPGRCYVSNWGGDAPAEGDPKALTSGTPIRIDPRTGVANHGTVSVIAAVPGKWKQVKTIEVGLHPCAMAASPRGRFVYVANAAGDTVSVIDRRSDTVVETIPCRPEGRLPFGSGPNALALSPDGGTLYVALGTNNCLAVVCLGTAAFDADPAERRPEKSTVAGLVPTGWYPGAILVSPDGKTLYVANIKGHGSLSQPRPKEKGKQTYDYLGSVSVIDVPDAGQLAKHTETVNANNRLAYSVAGLDKPRPDAKPVPVPARHGEPSVFKHVIYVIKENRTYDQVLGDMKEGNGDPKLVMFGEEVTPNHHALARQFTLFDNFYCSGVLSADGHTWVNQAYVSDYLERAFGGFTRDYPDSGTDPLAYAPTGFLWDNALTHKKTFRNYGEYVKSTYLPAKSTWSDWYAEYKAPGGDPKLKAVAKANLKTLEPYTHPAYPWFPLLMPDVYRARLFLDELKEFEKKGELPNLVYVTLPCDHTNATKPGFPTPRAMVADNDLALGQIVEAVSRSKFWRETCIFVVEDDPQNGFDHVDGHRTVALVISPYTKRKYVDHTNYNQTGMVKTIELILGLPTMNQLDLSATAMRHCFDSQPDPTPYAGLPSRMKLDEMNPPLIKLQGKALDWAKKSVALNLDDGDEADEDTMNRILWHATRGYDTPYPEEFAGARDD